MKPLFRRIALHGGLTALVLAAVGFGLAQLASIWLTASPGSRAATGAPIEVPNSNDPMVAALKWRMPLLMAVWGFVFVAVGELALYLWRGEKKPKAAPTPQPDETQKLLDDLLRQAEAAGRQGTGDRGQEPANPDPPPRAPRGDAR